MQTTIPLCPTPGLLVSMAIRFDHSYGLDRSQPFPGCFVGHDEESRAGLRAAMRGTHARLVRQYGKIDGDSVTIDTDRPAGLSGTDAQLLEEIVGTGFYSPEREAAYIAAKEGGPLNL